MTMWSLDFMKWSPSAYDHVFSRYYKMRPECLWPCGLSVLWNETRVPMTMWSLGVIKWGSSAYDHAVSRCYEMRPKSYDHVVSRCYEMRPECLWKRALNIRRHKCYACWYNLKFKTVKSVRVSEDMACGTPFAARNSCLLIRRRLDNRANDDPLLWVYFDYHALGELRNECLYL